MNRENVRMSNASGKLVILGILTVALASAGISWWFRYNLTHEAAEFWGPQAARLIRDAPTVHFWPHDPPADLAAVHMAMISTDNIVDFATIRDVTHARGLVHLRNALLDDRSFKWPPVAPPAETKWKWVLSFRNEAANDDAIVLISEDCRFMAEFNRRDTVLACDPLTSGLKEMIAEFDAEPQATFAR